LEFFFFKSTDFPGEILYLNIRVDDYKNIKKYPVAESTSLFGKARTFLTDGVTLQTTALKHEKSFINTRLLFIPLLIFI